MYTPGLFNEQTDVKPAWEWYQNHFDHVDSMVAKYPKLMYPPNGSDSGRPELWKPAHWKWFFESHKQSR